MPSVISARDHVLGDPITVDKWIEAVRGGILEEVCLAFEAMKRTEKEMFRERSFFRNRYRGTLVGVEEEEDEDLIMVD